MFSRHPNLTHLSFLSIRPTYYTIYKNKSSEGFQSIPYVVALLSAMLLLYYGVLKTNASLIISINAFGIAIELAYLIFYITYAPKKEKVSEYLYKYLYVCLTYIYIYTI